MYLCVIIDAILQCPRYNFRCMLLLPVDEKFLPGYIEMAFQECLNLIRPRHDKDSTVE